jgi:glycosyltransferase involved in cell wall biosynthesis
MELSSRRRIAVALATQNRPYPFHSGATMSPVTIEQYPAARRSLRLAVVTETYPPEINGVALSLKRMVSGLRERNHEIQLIRPRQVPTDQPTRVRGYDEVLTEGFPIPSYPNLRMGMPAKRILTNCWLHQRPDLVHIITEGPLGWSALQAAAKLKIPVCSDFRTNFHSYSQHYGIGLLKKPIVAYLRKFHNRTLATLVPTEQLRGELAGAGFRNLQVISRGVDTRLFDPRRRDPELRRRWGTDERTPVVLHVGRIAAEKNLTAISDAFARIRQRCPEARLLLVGDGPEAGNLRGQWPDAIFTGMLRGETLAAHYASADIFLFPSLTETFGNVTLEAMASGLPVVAFDYAAAGQHIRHGSNGLLASFGDNCEFAAAAGTLIDIHADDPVRFAGIGAQARETAEKLDWSHIVSELEHVLLTLARAGQADSHSCEYATALTGR